MKALPYGEKMEENKVCFIICYNNELYLQECLTYISALNVPDGIEVDVITVAEAKSMAAGYNAAMKASDAKYKVYLHQDVFIMNKTFIQDFIRIFKNNKEYGLLGVLGGSKQVNDANYWDKWNVGEIRACNSWITGMISYPNSGEEVECVVAVDGLIMIT